MVDCCPFSGFILLILPFRSVVQIKLSGPQSISQGTFIDALTTVLVASPELGLVVPPGLGAPGDGATPASFVSQLVIRELPNIKATKLPFIKYFVFIVLKFQR